MTLTFKIIKVLENQEIRTNGLQISQTVQLFSFGNIPNTSYLFTFKNIYIFF